MPKTMKQIDQIDSIDRKLLQLLQQNATLSHSALAEQVGSSTASVWRRIKALENADVLGPMVRLVDPQAIGRGVNVLCQVRMRSHMTANRQQFEDFIASRSEVMECYSMSGEWDYLLRVVVADVAGYEHFLMRELLGHPSVATCSSHFALSQVKYTTAMPV